jgi:tetratricopeptide (TPR) repeat protein
MGGVASALAMQFPVTDRAAVVFSEAFYAALAAGDPIEGAVAEGRLAVHQDRPDSWEWATPALYLGAADGELFRRARPEAPKPADEGAAGPEAGLSLLDLRKYDAAIDAFEKILKSSPEEADAHYYLALARMKGKQPRTHTLDLIRKVEEDLRVAVDINGDRAHSLYLWALVKENYYAWNGLRIPSPPVEELLAAAGRAQVDKARLRLLVDHLTTSPSRVREAVEAALGKD